MVASIIWTINKTFSQFNNAEYERVPENNTEKDNKKSRFVVIGRMFEFSYKFPKLLLLELIVKHYNMEEKKQLISDFHTQSQLPTKPISLKPAALSYIIIKLLIDNKLDNWRKWVIICVH